MKKGFTLIEVLISVVILSIMMLFLYKSYASLNYSNKFYKAEVQLIKEEQLLKKVIFLDFSLALISSTTIMNQDKNSDIVMLQSTNSLHRMYNPYITYIINKSKLYRLESLKKLTFPFDAESDFIVDFLGEVQKMRVYTNDQNSSNTTAGASMVELFLVNINFKKKDKEILLKIKALES